MTVPSIGLTLRVRVHTSGPTQGGIGPIGPLYRPVCIFSAPGTEDVLVGLCELELPEALEPGDVADGLLRFDVIVADEVKHHLTAGTEFQLAEGKRIVALARLIEVVDS